MTAGKQAAASQIRKMAAIPHTRANAKIPKKNRLEKASGRNGNRPPKIGSGKVLKFPHAREKGRLRKEAKLFLPTEPHLIISGGGVDQGSIFVYFRPANEKNPQKTRLKCKILAILWQNGGNYTEVDLG